MFMDNLRNILKKILYQNGEFTLYYKIDSLTDNQILELVSNCLNKLYREE